MKKQSVYTPLKLRKNSLQEAFGRKVREKRLALNLSQEALAELAGLHFTYISSVERGERNITLVNISRIAQALGCEMKDLLC